MLVALKRLGLVLGLMLGSLTRAGGQGTELRTGVVQTSSSPARVSPPAPGYVAYLFPAAGSTAAGFPQRLWLSYYGNEHQNSYTLSPFQKTKTSFMTESRLPVAQVWGARLQVNLFAVTLHTGNIMVGPLASIEPFHRQRQLGSSDLYGIGVSIPLGREVQREDLKGLWHNLPKIVHR